MDGMIREAALGPIRDVVNIETIQAHDVRKINHQDFLDALRQVRASVGAKDLQLYQDFEREYGSL
jgi:SpoVK/Ycf46/Vps4 family AAA+-type ATPase